jgi:protein TonB
MLAWTGAWSEAAAHDRLSSTLFLAALFHGILILGVTFTAAMPVKTPPATSLEVVLVTGDHKDMVTPLKPSLIAEQNLLGRGNAPLTARLRTALPQAADLALPGPDQPGAIAEPRPVGTPAPSLSRLTAAARDREALRPGESGVPAEQIAQSSRLQGEANDPELLAEADTVNEIPDSNPRELVVSASTRESRIAGYLNAWKTRVERIGTLNFPRSAELARIHSYPVLEVAISANGELKEVVVRSSSGHRLLDQAAMDILRMAAPFEPFPQRLRDDYDVLRFAYEWHFGGGKGTGRVSQVSGT